MTDRFFRYLDAVEADTEYSFVRMRLGPVFYNIPGPTKLMAHFGIDSETAVAAFRAWAKARGWKHPRDDPKWLKRVEELEAKYAPLPAKSGGA